MSGRLAATAVQGVAEDPVEEALSPWLKSSVFAGGLEQRCNAALVACAEADRVGGAGVGGEVPAGAGGDRGLAWEECSWEQRQAVVNAGLGGAKTQSLGRGSLVKVLNAVGHVDDKVSGGAVDGLRARAGRSRGLVCNRRAWRGLSSPLPKMWRGRHRQPRLAMGRMTPRACEPALLYLTGWHTLRLIHASSFKSERAFSCVAAVGVVVRAVFQSPHACTSCSLPVYLHCCGQVRGLRAPFPCCTVEAQWRCGDGRSSPGHRGVEQRY